MTEEQAKPANAEAPKAAVEATQAPVQPVASAVAQPVVKPAAPAAPAKPVAASVAAKPAKAPVKRAAAKPIRKPVAAPKARPAAKVAPKPAQKTAAAKPAAVAQGDVFNNAINTMKGIFPMNATAMNGFEDIQAMGKDNVDAVVESSKILSKGLEDLTRAWFDLAQNSVEQSVALSQAFLQVKSIKDVTELQNDLAKKNFDQFVAEGTKLSEMSIKVANDAAAPLTARVNEVVAKFGTTA